jgi:hypothetical protein
MDKRILAAAIGIVTAATLAVVAPASYAAEVVEITSPTTTRHYYVPPSTTTYYYAPPSTTTYATTTYTPPLTSYYYEPTVVEVRTAPAITVEAPVLTEDQAITEDVVDVLASNPYLNGTIGVETRNNDVTLSGSVTTPGQVRRAIRDTKSVAGVRTVNNELRSKVGGSSY